MYMPRQLNGLVFVFLKVNIKFQSCLTDEIYLSWVNPPKAAKPGKTLETVGMGIS